MRKLLLILLTSFAVAGVARAESRLGVGAEYLHSIKSIDVHNVDRNSIAYIASYQYRPATLLGFQADLEWLKTGLGGADKDLWAPQAFVVVGKGLYAAAGIGALYFDGNWGDKPIYTLRAGIDLEIISGIHLDINANYRFLDVNSLKQTNSDIGTDTVSLGAAVRIAL